jgi:PAS domain-containing protein
MTLPVFYDERPEFTVTVSAAASEPGRIVQSSRALDELLAGPSGQLVGAQAIEFIHPSDRRQAAYQFARLVNRRMSWFSGVGRLVVHGGETRWVSARAALVSAGSSEAIFITFVLLPVRVVPDPDPNRHRAARNRDLTVALDVGPTAVAVKSSA